MNHSPLINSKSMMTLMALAVSCPFAQAGTAGYISTSTAAGTSLVGPTAVYAGSEQDDINARETARREAMTKEAMQLLQEGRTAYKEGKYKEALEKFQAAWNRIPKAPATQQWQKHIVDCIGDASIAVAIEYSKVGRSDDAEQLLLDVLSRDPNNKRARKELSLLRDPVRNNPALTPEHVRDVEEVNRLLTLAYGYYDLGKYNEAYSTFNNVLQIDPYNTAARQGQESISKRRSNYYRAAYNSFRAKALAEVDAQWEERHDTSVPDLDTSSNSEPVREVTPDQLRVDEALNGTRIAAVNFEETPIEDALDFLRGETRKSGHQINFVFERPAAPAPVAEPSASSDDEESGDEEEGDSEAAAPAPVAVAPQPAVIASLRMNNLTARELLERMCSQAGCKFRVDDKGAVIVYPAGAGQEMLMLRKWKVPRTFVTSSGGDDSSGDDEDDAFSSSSSSGRSVRPDAMAALRDLGVTFPKGSFAKYSLSAGVLTVYNTPDNLDLVEDAIDDASRRSDNTMVKVSAKFVEVSQTNEEELGFDWVVNPFAVNNSGNAYVGGGSGANASTPKGPTDFVTSGGAAFNNNYPSSASGQWPVSSKGDVTSGLMTGGLRSGSGAISSNSLQSLIAAGSAASAATQNAAPGILSLSGIYDDGSFQMIMRGLSQKKGVDIMSAPSLVARPGELDHTPDPDPLSTYQQDDNGCAKIEVIRRFIYASNYTEPQVPERPEYVVAVSPSSPDEWSAQELGIVMRFKVSKEGLENDIITFDQFEIQVQDFEGFVNFGSPIYAQGIQMGSTIGSLATSAQSTDPVMLTENRIDMPIFSRRYINSNPCIYDGHTIVIGGMIEDQVQKVEDKVPVFGDLPLVGRFFRSNAESHVRKNLMIFVTAEKIDPSGKPTRIRNTGTSDAPAASVTPGLFPDDGLANP